jgi:hypothetical protein
MGQVIFARIEKLLLQCLFARTYALLFSEQLSSTDHLQEVHLIEGASVKRLRTIAHDHDLMRMRGMVVVLVFSCSQLDA